MSMCILASVCKLVNVSVGPTHSPMDVLIYTGMYIHIHNTTTPSRYLLGQAEGAVEVLPAVVPAPHLDPSVDDLQRWPL